MTMTEIPRLPRPAGLTQRCKALQHMEPSTQKQEKNKIKNELVYQWMIQGGTLNGVQYNIYELGILIGETRKRDILRRIQIASRLTDKTYSGTPGLKNKLLATTINSSLATRALVDQQLGLLIASQGGEYKPYISGEVNKAIKLRLDSDKNLQELTKILTPAPGIQINNTNEASVNNNVQHITAHQAIAMLDERFGESILESPGEVKALTDKYNTKGLPDITAWGEDTKKAQTIDITPTKHDERRELGEE